MRLAAQILGGGTTGRLVTDVCDRRRLAQRIDVRIIELAHGPQPLVIRASADPRTAAAALTAILENLSSLANEPPSLAETAAARRALVSARALRAETVGALVDGWIADHVVGDDDTQPADLAAMAAEKPGSRKEPASA